MGTWTYNEMFGGREPCLFVHQWQPIVLALWPASTTLQPGKNAVYTWA